MDHEEHLLTGILQIALGYAMALQHAPDEGDVSIEQGSERWLVGHVSS